MTQRHPAFFLLLILLAAPAGDLLAGTTAPFTRGPYPQLATPTGVTIVWRTRGVMLPEVRVGTSPKLFQITFNVDRMAARRTVADGPSTDGFYPLHSAPTGTTQFEAALTGLTPDTKYYYAIFDAGKLLTPDDGSCCFSTLPEPGAERPCTFWVVGDSGTATESQRAVHRAFVKWRERKRANVDFYMHVGDMAYNKGMDSEFQYGFFDIYADTLRGLTCWPAMGNHEGGTSKGTTGLGPYYDAYVSPKNAESGGTPSGTEAYYSWDFGRVHFIALDSHDLPRKADGQMAQWLKADLEKTSADWIIAYWHHPPYTKGSHDSDKEKDLTEIREYIMPIIESGGVDLVLTGHSHIYERSFLVDGAYKTPTVAENCVLDDDSGDPKGHGPYHKRPGILPNEGTLQIVTGHGGQALSRKDEPHPLMRRSIVEWGSVIVEVNGNKLTATMLNADGRERDHVQIVKDAKAPPQRLARPRKPEPAEGPKRLKSFDARADTSADD
jgi:acid phosphatase type 7